MKNALSYTEEDYLKAIYQLSANSLNVSTNAIAEALDTKPASVSDMIKRLSSKNYIHYIKYKGVSLTEEGKKYALRIVRKHRLWEVFLVEKLGFNWDEVHEIAEQLEHIRSSVLIEKLDIYLGCPEYDPHGDPIPNRDGTFPSKEKVLLSELPIHDKGIIIGVSDGNPALLRHLDKLCITLGALIEVVDRIEYDQSMEIKIGQNAPILISREVAQNIYIKK